MSAELKINKNEAVLWFNEKGTDLSSVDEVINQLKKQHIHTVYAKADDDIFSSLITSHIYDWQQKLSSAGFEFNYEQLPPRLRDLIDLALRSINTPPTQSVTQIDWLEKLGTNGFAIYQKFISALHFIKTCFEATGRFISGKAIYRKRDFWFIFADCSYQAVGITALVSFLVGLILAFVGAMQLRTFGAGIYVASMVALGMTRIMAAIMVGIIMAGRTGSSYAATLGTMQVNEEIDALKTLGIKVTDYLVAPRMICLVLTIPFLTLLADVLGIFGGAVVGISFLDISSTSYLDYSIKALTLKNILVGLLHSVVYGIIIAICGCYEGLTAGRDADAVGKATTSAVVTALVWMIVATGILTVLLEVLGI
jgi:phospholipid/cholesterol/gamma-HCH transport system permease protein